MTNERMGKSHIDQALQRFEIAELMMERGYYPDVVREAQECVELFLKGALRSIGIEPMRTHNVAECFLMARQHFPTWFGERIEELSAASRHLGAHLDTAFYGDERHGIPPQQLFTEVDAQRAMQFAHLVRDCCTWLRDEFRGGLTARIATEIAGFRNVTLGFSLMHSLLRRGWALSRHYQSDGNAENS